MYITIAFKNVILHWKHSLGTIIAVASGFISLCMFQGYMDDVEKLYVDTFAQTKMFGDVILEHNKFSESEGKANPNSYTLPPAIQSRVDDYLSNSEYVSLNVKFLNISGIITNGPDQTIFEGRGYDVQNGRLMRTKIWEWDTMYGAPLYIKEKNTIVLGHSLAKLLNCKENKTVRFYNPIGGYKAEVRPFTCDYPVMQLMVTTVNDQTNAMRFEVGGFLDANYKEVDNKYLETNLENAQLLMDTKDISYYSVKLNNEKDMERFISISNSYFQNHSLDLKAISWKNHEIGEMYIRTMQLLSIFRNFIVIVIVFIAGLSIFNTINKIVRERTKEIGTLRSIGYGEFTVTKIFLFESLFLVLAGVLLGMIISFVSMIFINMLGITYKAGVLTQPVLFKIQASPQLYMYSAVFLILLAMITAYFAITQITKKKIVDCLNYV